MSDPAVAARFQRASALEEKRRKLDELKKKREDRGTDTARIHATQQQQGTSNLDEYIDDLLKDSITKTSATTGTGTANATATATATDPSSSTGPNVYAHDGMSEDNANAVTSLAYQENGTTAPSSTSATIVTATTLRKQIEMFSISTQTDDDVDDDELFGGVKKRNEDDEERKEKHNNDEFQSHTDKSKNNRNAIEGTSNDMDETPKILSFNEVEKEVTKQPFSMFINTASKKVERMLLGGSAAAAAAATQTQDLFMVDYVAESIDNDNRNVHTKGDTDENGSKFIQSKYIFECPKWTNHRDVTDLDWSPIHRELLLTTYHSMNSAISNNTAPSTSTGGTGGLLSKVDQALSSSLTPRSGELLSDGLALIWSPMLPNRPEHVFTCGSPVTCGKFHPTDPTLIIGGCYSGQLVLWDIRSGRLPVQKSSIPTGVASTTTVTSVNQLKGHHAHAIGSMEILDGGLSLATASVDGRLNFWSMTNLRDPAESIQVGDSISCFAVLPESETLVVADEHGVMYTVASPNSSATAVAAPVASSGKTSPVPPSSITASTLGGGSGQRVSRRQVKRMDMNGEGDSNLGHYGMITSISTKLRSCIKNNSNNQALHVGTTSKGFLRGVGGLLVSSGVDWTVKLWAPAFHSDKPLMSYVSHSYDYMSDVAWSTTHPSLFATASSNGSIGLWNLSTSLDEPITGPEGIVVQPDSMSSGVGLNKIKWSADGRRIAVASSDKVHILNLSDDVTRTKGDEETKVMNIFLSRGLI